MAEDVVIISRRAVVAGVLVLLLLGGVFVGGLFRQQQSIDKIQRAADQMHDAWVRESIVAQWLAVSTCEDLGLEGLDPTFGFFYYFDPESAEHLTITCVSNQTHGIWDPEKATWIDYYANGTRGYRGRPVASPSLVAPKVFRPEAPDNWIANITKQSDIWHDENWGKWVFSSGNWALQKRSSEFADGYAAPNYIMLHNTDMDTTYVFVNDSVGWAYIKDRNGQWWKVN